MGEALAGVVGGLGLFIVGMNMLTENLKALANRRLRRTAARWIANRFSALLWGAVAGTITQSMSALTFIVVSLLRSGLTTTHGALALILGGCVGGSLLVVAITLDIKLAALIMLGLSGAAMVSERLTKIRHLATAFVGASLLILGLTLVKDSAAPLADHPWFSDMVAGTRHSLILAFLAAALLAALSQSANAVTVIAIGFASVSVLTLDQVIMVIYGTCLGSSAVLYALSINLKGRSRQVAMYMVLYDALTPFIFVPALYIENHLGIPLIKALIASTGAPLEQQLALVYVLISVLPLPILLATVRPCAAALEHLWPDCAAETRSKPRYIYDHAHSDADTALMLVDLELKGTLTRCSAQCKALRRSEPVAEIRDAIAELLNEIAEFIEETARQNPSQEHERRNDLKNRVKAMRWLNQSLAALCEAIGPPAPQTWLRAPMEDLKDTLRESADTALMTLNEAVNNGDEFTWDATHHVNHERGVTMNKVRSRYVSENPPLNEFQFREVLLATNCFEEFFHAIRRVEESWNPYSYE